MCGACGIGGACQTNARSCGTRGTVFYTFRKSLLLSKPRDVPYRQRKSLRMLAGCISIRVRLDINQMADADQSRLARTHIECSFKVAWMRERRPTNHACDPIIGARIGEQCLVFR